MLCQIKVTAMRDALKFTKAGVGEGEFELDIHRAEAIFGVMRQLILVMVAHQDIVLLDADGNPPVFALFNPKVKPFLDLIGVAKPLHFHLLELT